MVRDLRRARGTESEEEFGRAAARFGRMKQENIALARAYLLAPGQLQVDIATANNVSPQLVYKQCKKIYASHCLLSSDNVE
jgi:hypothetical protein